MSSRGKLVGNYDLCCVISAIPDRYLSLTNNPLMYTRELPRPAIERELAFISCDYSF